jgi:hypothetical protein
VHVVKSSDILDFKTWWPRYYKKNCISLETASRTVARDKKISFGVASFHHLIYTAGVLGTLKASTMIMGLDSTLNTFNLGLPSLSCNIPFPSSPAYPRNHVLISGSKMVDIKKSSEYNPQEEDVQSFWTEILQWPTLNDNI